MNMWDELHYVIHLLHAHVLLTNYRQTTLRCDECFNTLFLYH